VRHNLRELCLGCMATVCNVHRVLSLSANSFGDIGLKALLPSLQLLSRLERLDLFGMLACSRSFC
jgi:hypothetical protein